MQLWCWDKSGKLSMLAAPLGGAASTGAAAATPLASLTAVAVVVVVAGVATAPFETKPSPVKNYEILPRKKL